MYACIYPSLFGMEKCNILFLVPLCSLHQFRCLRTIVCQRTEEKEQDVCRAGAKIGRLLERLEELIEQEQASYDAYLREAADHDNTKRALSRTHA